MIITLKCKRVGFGPKFGSWHPWSNDSIANGLMVRQSIMLGDCVKIFIRWKLGGVRETEKERKRKREKIGVYRKDQCTSIPCKILLQWAFNGPGHLKIPLLLRINKMETKPSPHKPMRYTYPNQSTF